MKIAKKIFGITAVVTVIVFGTTACVAAPPGQAQAQPAPAQPGQAPAQFQAADGSLQHHDPTQPVIDVAQLIHVDMVAVSGGNFPIGSSADEIGRFPNEAPQRQTTLTGFYMSTNLVTQALWEEVMGNNPSFFFANPAAGEVQGLRPVEWVSWYDVLVFANRLSVLAGFTPAYMIDGSVNPAHWGPVPTTQNAMWDAVIVVEGATGFRLPTEAQWEFAARAGTNTAFSNGTQDWAEGQSQLDSIGWFDFNSGGMTRQVALKEPNAWGLHDMHGNVFEWTWDRFGAYTSEAQVNPTGAEEGATRVVRGGDWLHSARYARSANRSHETPATRVDNLGFRLVRPTN